jgi:hypothetical protein
MEGLNFTFKVAALKLLEAPCLSLDRPLPDKPPNVPDRLFRLVGRNDCLDIGNWDLFIET